MANKYTDKEIIAAINTVNSILEVEDFALDIGEYSIDGSGWTTALKFDVDDMQNNGRLEDKIFENLDDVIRETNVYSSILDSFHNRVGAETIPQNDWDRKALIFLTSDYCKELLSSITASTYSDYVKTGFGKNQDRLKENEGTDELSLLLDKDIAQKIIETQSAYVMVEYNDKVYLSYYGYGDNKYYEPIIDEDGVIIDDDLSKPIEPKEALLSNIKATMQIYDENGNNEIFTTYNNYGELIKNQLDQVRNDINDLGLYEMYLSRDELKYIGLETEIKNYEKKYNELIISANEERSEMQARNLPEGWHWIDYDDASGYLKSPEGIKYFDYDWNTGEYKVTEDKNYDFFLKENYSTGGYSIGSFKEFKTFAENWIKGNILKSEQIKKNATLSKPIIVANFVEEDKTINVIMQYPNGLYYNHYGYDIERDISNCNVGGFKTLDEAKKMMVKHRSTSIEITDKNNNSSIEDKEIENEEPDICE